MITTINFPIPSAGWPQFEQEYEDICEVSLLILSGLRKDEAEEVQKALNERTFQYLGSAVSFLDGCLLRPEDALTKTLVKYYLEQLQKDKEALTNKPQEQLNILPLREELPTSLPKEQEIIVEAPVKAVNNSNSKPRKAAATFVSGFIALLAMIFSLFTSSRIKE